MCAPHEQYIFHALPCKRDERNLESDLHNALIAIFRAYLFLSVSLCFSLFLSVSLRFSPPWPERPLGASLVQYWTDSNGLQTLKSKLWNPNFENPKTVPVTNSEPRHHHRRSTWLISKSDHHTACERMRVHAQLNECSLTGQRAARAFMDTDWWKAIIKWMPELHTTHTHRTMWPCFICLVSVLFNMIFNMFRGMTSNRPVISLLGLTDRCSRSWAHWQRYAALLLISSTQAHIAVSGESGRVRKTGPDLVDGLISRRLLFASQLNRKKTREKLTEYLPLLSKRIDNFSRLIWIFIAAHYPLRSLFGIGIFQIQQVLSL